MYIFKDVRLLVHFSYLLQTEGKYKSIPVMAYYGPRGFLGLTLQISRQLTQEVVKFVSTRHMPPLPPGYISGTHFC